MSYSLFFDCQKKKKKKKKKEKEKRSTILQAIKILNNCFKMEKKKMYLEIYDICFKHITWQSDEEW